MIMQNTKGCTSLAMNEEGWGNICKFQISIKWGHGGAAERQTLGFCCDSVIYILLDSVPHCQVLLLVINVDLVD